MFVFSRLLELDKATEEINQELFRKCPELSGKKVIGLCLRNGDVNAIMAGVTFFYRVLALNNRPRSKKNVEELFECIQHGTFYKWD